MKVYELIAELNKLPAGAEVIVHGLRTVPELRNGCHGMWTKIMRMSTP